ncbi:rhodanese-related sulfurtransferase [Fontibacillus phaseoli]|uniref:Rhodanese-related sulfurtransferase n=1 Tax=Fontibacillus phaseoli TaxID=1416533 RepID=A0A369B6C7_9BACL|nr:rhodanese-like domain-containing protein [Fontibacillus phaseoli]RCX16168.1 rhodanese-related sulfurtransferase [Fontibacillus phaseoli]
MSFQPDREISAHELAERIERGDALNIVDVREPVEWEEGHIRGAKHIPLGQLPERYEELDPKQEWFIVCRSGARSGLACELLSERGYKAVNMAGGLLAWRGELV